MNTEKINAETKGGVKKSRRDIIKNVAIIFLAVMLVLTFFSNTVMNMSLPEVSAQYAAAGNVSEQIRGSGTVTAGQNYDVVVNETRKISGVFVKAGDAVEKGDVIYTLDGQESTELSTAEKTLRDLELAYRKAVIAADNGTGYLVEKLELENARDDIREINEKIYKYNDEDFIAKTYASDYLNLNQIKKDIAALEAKCSEIGPIKETSVQIDNKINELTAAIACLDTDDFSPLPDEWYGKVNAAKENLDKYPTEEEAKAKVSAIEGYISALDTTDMLGLPYSYYNRIASYLADMEEAQTTYDNAKKSYETLQAEIGDIPDYSDQIREKRQKVTEKTEDLDLIVRKIVTAKDDEELQKLYEERVTIQRDINNLNEDLRVLIEKSNAGSNNSLKLKSALNKMTRAQNALSAAAEKVNKEKRAIKAELIVLLNDAKKNAEDLSLDSAAADSRKAAEKEFADVKKEAKADLNRQLNDYKTKQTNLQTLEETQKSLDDKKNEYTKSKAELEVKMETDKQTLEDSLEEKKRSLESLEANFEVKQKTDSVTNRQTSEDLRAQEKEIAEQKKTIEDLKKKSEGENVLAPVSGIIQSVAYAAGESTAAGNAAAVIAMTDKGYTLSFSVKAEQAKKLTVGAAADVANNYFGSDITATLSAIKTDTSNPQTNKVLEFTVTGSDVKQGDSVTLTVGAKGQQYQAVVPNSAVRNDKNGNYVLVVESKNSALGSRYFASRYAVEVLAQNDTSAAVSGLSGSEFVITTSSMPISDGQQVKMADTAGN